MYPHAQYSKAVFFLPLKVNILKIVYLFGALKRKKVKFFLKGKVYFLISPGFFVISQHDFDEI